MAKGATRPHVQIAHAKRACRKVCARVLASANNILFAMTCSGFSPTAEKRKLANTFLVAGSTSSRNVARLPGTLSPPVSFKQPASSSHEAAVTKQQSRSSSQNRPTPKVVVSPLQHTTRGTRDTAYSTRHAGNGAPTGEQQEFPLCFANNNRALILR